MEAVSKHVTNAKQTGSEAKIRTNFKIQSIE